MPSDDNQTVNSEQKRYEFAPFAAKGNERDVYRTNVSRAINEELNFRSALYTEYPRRDQRLVLCPSN